MAADGELSLGAYFGRYKGWRSAVDVPTPAPVEGEAPVEVTIPEGALVLQFEATAMEDVRVGFAAHGSYQWRYEVALGFSGNTEVAVRKALGNGGANAKEIDLATVFCGRTCSAEHFIPYWVVVQQGSIVMGIGKEVGVDTVIKTADTKDPVAVHQVALTTWNQGATVRNLQVQYVTSAPLPIDSWTPRMIVRADPMGTEDLLTDAQRAEYQQEVEVAQRRAARFGGEFVAPDLKKFLDPKVIRRLQRTGATERGFSTGFDLTSQDEVSKREARMKRFDTPQFAVEYSSETVRALQDGLTQEEWAEREAEKQKLRERALKFGLDPDANPKSGAKVMNLKPASRKVREERCDIKVDTMVEDRDDAIHLYSLDERFQQVRTNDIMEYFTGYGPWYVEWINDSSCTVVFEDAGTAGRALVALSDEVPPQMLRAKKSSSQEPSNDEAAAVPTAEKADGDVDMDDSLDPASGETEDAAAAPAEPAETPDEDFNRSQWRYGQAIGSATQPRDKRWRLLMRRATADDFPPEKNKKYHDRRSLPPQQRGRGHRDPQHQSRHRDNNRSNARSHPYSRNSNRRGGRRGGDRDRDSGDFDSMPPRDSGPKASSRVRVNADGSIDFVRNRDGGSAAAPSEDN